MTVEFVFPPDESCELMVSWSCHLCNRAVTLKVPYAPEIDWQAWKDLWVKSGRRIALDAVAHAQEVHDASLDDLRMGARV